MDVPSHYCDPEEKPQHSRDCQIHCPGQCVVSEWTEWSTCLSVSTYFAASLSLAESAAALLYHHPYNFIFYSRRAERLLRKWVSEKEKELVKDRRRRHVLLEMFPTFRGEQSL